MDSDLLVWKLNFFLGKVTKRDSSADFVDWQDMVSWATLRAEIKTCIHTGAKNGNYKTPNYFLNFGGIY